MAAYVKAIAMWPLEAVDAIKGGSYLAPAAALGVPYYMYGLPSVDGGLQPALMWYGVAGVSFLVAAMALGAPVTASGYYYSDMYYGGPATPGGNKKPGPAL